jgi:hypothetical protein
LLVCVTAANLFAQDNEHSPLNNVKMNLLLSTAYSYNFNNPANMKNTLRVFDYDNNSFKVDVMQISLHQDVSNDNPFGFRGDIAAGSSIPGMVHSAGLNSGDLDITQLYITYIINAGNGIRVDFGKFVTFMGYEVIEGWENFNENYTRSFLFGYSIPFCHTGIKASYSFSDKLSISAFLVNGWDDAVDNNKSKSLGAQIALFPVNGLSIFINGMTGPEQANNNSDYRNIVDISGGYTNGCFTFGFNTNYAHEDYSAQNLPSAEWGSIAGYLKCNMSELFSLALRGELFKDSQGVRTGTKQNLSEITITPALNLSRNLVLRGDLRFDWSDNSVFNTDTSTSKNQVTTAFNLIYHF